MTADTDDHSGPCAIEGRPDAALRNDGTEAVTATAHLGDAVGRP